MAKKHDNKPLTKVDLMRGLELMARRIAKLFRAEILAAVKRIEAIVRGNQKGFLAAEKAVIDKLKEHEERIKQLEEHKLNNPYLN